MLQCAIGFEVLSSSTKLVHCSGLLDQSKSKGGKPSITKVSQRRFVFTNKHDFDGQRATTLRIWITILNLKFYSYTETPSCLAI